MRNVWRKTLVTVGIAVALAGGPGIGMANAVPLQPPEPPVPPVGAEVEPGATEPPVGAEVETGAEAGGGVTEE